MPASMPGYSLIQYRANSLTFIRPLGNAVVITASLSYSESSYSKCLVHVITDIWFSAQSHRVGLCVVYSLLNLLR